MKIDRVQILCHNIPANGKFTNEITGRVILTVHKQIILKDDINLTLEGKACVRFSSHEVEWVKHDNVDYSTLQLHDFLRKLKYRRRLSDSETFSEERIVTRVAFPLVSAGKSLKCGDNTFSFNFHLDSNLPSSFESKHGSIKYKLKVRKKVNHTIYKIEVKLGSPDMNTLLWQNPKWNTGFSFAGKMKDDEIVIGLFLNKTCFVIGETSQLTVEVNNQSDLSIYSLILHFKQVTVWIGKSGSRRNAKVKEEVLSSFDFSSVRARDVKQFTLNFSIPPVPYSAIRINTCPIIRIYNVFTVIGKYREFLSSTKCCIDVPVEIFPRTGPVGPVGPSSVPVGFLYQPSPSSVSSTPSVNVINPSTAYSPLTVNMPSAYPSSIPFVPIPSFSVNPSSSVSTSSSPSFVNVPTPSGSSTSSVPPHLSVSSSIPTSIYPPIPSDLSSSSVQPSAPSAPPLLPLNPPSYSSLSDPPPPYPGTPPDLAESIQKLRFS